MLRCRGPKLNTPKTTRILGPSYNKYVKGVAKGTKYVNMATKAVRDTPPKKEEEEWTRFEAKVSGKITWANNETGKIWQSGDIG